MEITAVQRVRASYWSTSGWLDVTVKVGTPYLPLQSPVGGLLGATY